jgi:protein-tyrosine phosphatase
VTSAGTLDGERPIAPAALRALGPAADAMVAHTSRRLQEADVAGADVVVGMAREHVREAVVLCPDAWERSFTLKELVRRAARIGPRPPDLPLGQWLGRAGAGRRSADLLGSSTADDVPDPLGASPAVMRRTAAEIRSAVETLFDLAWPPGR